MAKTNVTINEIESDGRMAVVTFVDGKQYKLQHPGNRTYIQWQQEYVTPMGFNMEEFLDKSFEHVVIPMGHDFKPTIDNIKPKELEVWQKLLRRFLGGDIESDQKAEKPVKGAERPTKAQAEN